MAGKIEVPGGQPIGQGGPAGKGAAKPGSLKDELRRKPALVVGIGGAAVVVVYALMKRSSAAAAGTTDTTGTSSGTTSNTTPTYDSSANDVYNSLEDQLVNMNSAIAALTPPPQGVVTPPPATTTAAAPSIKSGFYRNVSTGNIYEVANGKRFSVTPSTWKKIDTGKTAPKVNSIDNSWNGLQLKLQGTKV
jgi:hypothetical protein